MFWNSGKIIETLATIKANTANHKDDLKDMKETFDKHIEKEEIRQVSNDKKMADIHSKVSNINCPYDDRIQKLEDRYVKIQKDKARELIADAETKANEIKDRAKDDKEVAKNISSLQARSKYNLLSMAGVWSVIVVLLKKAFMP